MQIRTVFARIQCGDEAYLAFVAATTVAICDVTVREGRHPS